MGSVLVLDAKLSKGNLIYGVDVESNKRSEILKNKDFEYNAKHLYDRNIEVLKAPILQEIDKIDRDTEISINSIEEGSYGDPGMGNTFGGMAQKIISNRRKEKFYKKIGEINKLNKK